MLFYYSAPQRLKAMYGGAKHDRRCIFFRLVTPIFPLCGFPIEDT